MSSNRRHRTDNDERDRLIRHHLEEASTHLAALKQEAPHLTPQLTKIGKYLKALYVRHGGTPH